MKPLLWLCVWINLLTVILLLAVSCPVSRIRYIVPITRCIKLSREILNFSKLFENFVTWAIGDLEVPGELVVAIMNNYNEISLMFAAGSCIRIFFYIFVSRNGKLQ